MKIKHFLKKKKEREKSLIEEEPEENLIKKETGISLEFLNNINLKKFSSKIFSLKNAFNYKEKGPYIYCIVKKDLKSIDSSSQEIFNIYHAGIFECTNGLLIHYGEKDENGKEKPLTLEKLIDDDLLNYIVIKYFYSQKKPEDFINLIDKNEWTSEKYDELNHNCIQCVNEYLILNNITPIPFGIGKSIAYEYLCDQCFKELVFRKDM